MSEHNDQAIPEHLSPADMRDWLRQEIRDASKAVELRLTEASELVMAYGNGDLTPEEAHERHWRYLRRWGEALPGVVSGDNMTNEEIIQRIDQNRVPDPTLQETERRYQSLFETRTRMHKPSR